MKSLKRNQVIIFVIALMLVSAGYLSYTANNDANTIQTSTELNTTLEYAGIGDAKLVNSNGVVDSNTVNENAITNEQLNNENIENIENKNVETNNKDNVVETNAKEIDEYFASSKLTRDTMYSQMIETYEKILENEKIASDQKTIAQTEIKNINDCKNKIMICENLIKTKGIKDSVIFINGESVSVVIRSEKLEQDQIAQIQNIIAREMQAEISNIHISNK
ncbi:MAG: SpoIIIAH-like family protein [Clostridia bacterium]|nr:SpoIIIAH-like family protein [Clostridia bacterium]